jgi:type IV secretory pathway VirB6-like protein
MYIEQGSGGTLSLLYSQYSRGRGRGRQISEFESSLVYRVSSNTAWATQRNPILNMYIYIHIYILHNIIILYIIQNIYVFMFFIFILIMNVYINKCIKTYLLYYYNI